MELSRCVGVVRRAPIPSAPVLWASVVAVVLIADAALVAQNRETMSDWYGRHTVPLTIIAAYLHLHLHGRPKRLARFDPLHLCAEAIRKSGVANGPLASLL